MPASSEGSSADDNSSADVSSEPVAGDFDFALGKQLYVTHCVACHGTTGQGGTSDEAFPFGSRVDFDRVMFRTNGGALGQSNNAGTMPSGSAFGKEYSPEDCTDDCAYQIAGYIANGFPGAEQDEGGSELGFEGCSEAEGASATRYAPFDAP